MRPAPVSSASVSVSSATTRLEVSQRARAPPDCPRPPSFIRSFRFVFDTCIAGASPKTMPVARQIAAKYPNTARSRSKTIQYGFPTPATAASNSRTPTEVSPNPSRPPRQASMTLSMSSCRTIRPRLAPSAVRTAISRARYAERASSRLATFAHAMSSTKPTAPSSERKISRIGPPLKRSLNVIRRASMFLFCSG